MSRMIPSYISPDVKSNAEKKVFRWFKESTGTENWIVLHSLGISKHIKLIHGEIDLVVLAPQKGIFALEVKGGRVRRENGIWYFTDKYGSTTAKSRGPFEQASDGIFSIIEALKKKFGSKSSIPGILYGYGVMFPDIIFSDDTIEINKWQIYDITDNDNVKGFIDRLSHNYAKQMLEKFNAAPKEKLPDDKVLKDIVSYLRGDFDKPAAFQTEINEAEEIQKILTAEQFCCLDALEDNPRCVVQGPAGTGKTILAIEDTVRSLSKNENVALVCYNSLLGEHLKQYFKKNDNYGKPYYVGTFHSLMLNIIKKAGIEIEKQGVEQEDFWETGVPSLVLNALRITPLRIDKIIIDEAQDLLTDNYLDVVDSLILRGLDRGKWSFFGDFSRQSIYNDISYDSLIEMPEKRASFINYKLSVNCRNTLQICGEMQYITGFSDVKYPQNAANGLLVNYLTWKNDDEQIRKINMTLDRLIDKEHIASELITVLSSRKMEASVISGCSRKITPYSTDLNDSVSFCTIQSFKGLENSIVLLVDVESYNNSKMLYIGLSRARAALYVFESENAHAERTNLLLKAVKNVRYEA
ncbi:nuclease [Spirochaetia bacterium]|nr:nuclease [Spirochaetia bacterium]